MKRPAIHDQGERWDNRRPVANPGVLFGAVDCRALAPYWRGPTNPQEARLADIAMVDLGRVMFSQRNWEIDQIEKRSGF